MLNNFTYSFFYLFNYFFSYIENLYLVFYGKLGSFKFLNNLLFLLFNKNNIYIFKNFIINDKYGLNKNKKSTLNRIIFKNILSRSLVSIYTGFRAKFKIVGRGYKLHKKNNSLVFKLGYSHLIFKILDFSLFLKKKEKKKLFFTLISIHYQKMSNYVRNFKLYRIPNIYKRKGIFNNTKKVLFKFGKANMV